MLRCIAEDGQRVVRHIIKVSEAGRAPRNDPALVDSASVAPEVVLGPSGNVGGRNPLAHAAGVGQLLQLRFHLETFQLH